MGKWDNGEFRVNRPAADKLLEAISQGYSRVQDGGMARYLGRVARQTEGFMLATPSRKTYSSPQSIIIPENYLQKLQEKENYMLFGIKPNKKPQENGLHR